MSDQHGPGCDCERCREIAAFLAVFFKVIDEIMAAGSPAPPKPESTFMIINPPSKWVN